ncbi:XRE family transcriptional regulator [bacterium]|nr:XRE family transcriptional regulator [bacterium]
MFINKAKDGKNNICGKNINFSKRTSAITTRTSRKMQIVEVDIDKNAVQRIEAGKRFVTDIELIGFSKVLNKNVNELLF